VIGDLYTRALAGHARPEIEHADGTRVPLAVDDWLDASPGDASILDRCDGPTLDVGSGPGRLTVALAERGIPALGIDITPYAVQMARSAGALALLRDVFGRVPGAGRWETVLLADGNIGIGGDPVALLRRIGELLTPGGQAIIEIQPPGTPLRKEQVRLRHADTISDWFPWAYVGADQIAEVADSAGLTLAETWSADERWFSALSPVGLPDDPSDPGDVVLDGSDVSFDGAEPRLRCPYGRCRKCLRTRTRWQPSSHESLDAGIAAWLRGRHLPRRADRPDPRAGEAIAGSGQDPAAAAGDRRMAGVRGRGVAAAQDACQARGPAHPARRRRDPARGALRAAADEQ
jgi:SAM-dependent methyltransferase